MSHGIIKGFDFMFSLVREWHDLQTLVKSINEETISPMLFDLIRRPIKFADRDEKQIDDVFALVPADMPNHRLNLVRDSYGEVSNRKLLEALQNSLPSGAKITTAMTLWARKEVAFSIELPEALRKGPNGEQYRQHFTLHSSHDGNSNVSLWDTMTRVVCANTLAASIGDRKTAKGRVSFRHSKNVETRLEGFEARIAALWESQDEFFANLAKMAEQSLNLEQARAITATQVVNGSKLSTRSYNQADSIVNLFAKGIGNKGETVYDLFNAGTQYWTRGDETRKDGPDVSKIWVSSEFEGGAVKKSEWYEVLTDSNLDELAERGEQLLKTYRETKATASA